MDGTTTTSAGGATALDAQGRNGHAQPQPSPPSAVPAHTDQREHAVELEVGPLQQVGWREHVLAHVTSLQGALQDCGVQARDRQGRLAAARAHLKAARQAAAEAHGPVPGWTGAAVERAWANIHSAQAILLELASEQELLGRGADVAAQVEAHLAPQDPRRRALTEALAGKFDISTKHRRAAVDALRAAYAASEQEHSRVRSFRNVVYVCVVLAVVLAVALGLLGAWRPGAVDLCFSTTPPSGSEPRSFCATGNSIATGGDVALLEFFGLLAAAVAGAASLRRIRGTSTPYSVPLALALLRLPLGALTGVLGVVLVRGGFVPGLSELDHPGQILAWAVIFGAAQEAVTRVIDRRGQTVLDDVGSAGEGAATAKGTAPAGPR